MSLQPLIQFIVVPLLGSVAAMTYAVSQNEHLLSRLSAAAFFVVVVTVAILVNKPHWPKPAAGTNASALFHTMRRNTRLAALTYAWAGAALLSVYTFSGLKWQHGWQYGLGAALIAAGLLAYVRQMGASGRDLPPPAILNSLHALAVSFGLLFLVGSGTMASFKGDWAANNIFLYGGMTILALCFIAARTQRAFAAGQR